MLDSLLRCNSKNRTVRFPRRPQLESLEDRIAPATTYLWDGEAGTDQVSLKENWRVVGGTNNSSVPGATDIALFDGSQFNGDNPYLTNNWVVGEIRYDNGFDAGGGATDYELSTGHWDLSVGSINIIDEGDEVVWKLGVLDGDYGDVFIKDSGSLADESVLTVIGEQYGENTVAVMSGGYLAVGQLAEFNVHYLDELSIGSGGLGASTGVVELAAGSGVIPGGYIHYLDTPINVTDNGELIVGDYAHIQKAAGSSSKDLTVSGSVGKPAWLTARGSSESIAGPSIIKMDVSISGAGNGFRVEEYAEMDIRGDNTDAGEYVLDMGSGTLWEFGTDGGSMTGDPILRLFNEGGTGRADGRMNGGAITGYINGYTVAADVFLVTGATNWVLFDDPSSANGPGTATFDVETKLEIGVSVVLTINIQADTNDSSVLSVVNDADNARLVLNGNEVKFHGYNTPPGGPSQTFTAYFVVTEDEDLIQGTFDSTPLTSGTVAGLHTELNSINTGGVEKYYWKWTTEDEMG